jgi:hypothetical protein
MDSLDKWSELKKTDMTHMGEKRNACRILVGRPEGKRPSWKFNIEMDLREIGWDSMDWIDLAEDRNQWRAFANKVMNLQVP